MADYDYCVIGGGIVGLATAKAVQEAEPGARIIVLEKESGLARHQTGHNSGVIHAGIYYQPGSLKARLCLAGAQATKAFCKQYSIPFESCGKLLVATSALEMERMEALARRAVQNNIAAIWTSRHCERRSLPFPAWGRFLFPPPVSWITQRSREPWQRKLLSEAASCVSIRR